jgi:hypothetical protein
MDLLIKWIIWLAGAAGSSGSSGAGSPGGTGTLDQAVCQVLMAVDHLA